jgi:hypothetical protein
MDVELVNGLLLALNLDLKFRQRKICSYKREVMSAKLTLSLNTNLLLHQLEPPSQFRLQVDSLMT